MRPAGATEQGGKMVSSDAANEPAIVAEGVSKLFLDGTVVAFHQLSLAVKRDEIMCVVGPSGCGKTTLLRCIAGLTDLSSGKLLVHGKPVAGRPPDGVAMVFQHFGLLPWKTVYDNAAFGLAMAGASQRRSASGSRIISNWSGSPASSGIIPTSSPAGCSSASAWCARSP